jgi:hypothetical protein
MSTTGDLPGLPGDELDGDHDAVFDELARRAGAALRRPAPEDGVQVIAARQRRQQALKASVVGGIAVATLIGALVVVANRDDPDSLPPVDSSPPTSPATTTPAPTPTAVLPAESLPATLPATTGPTPTAIASIPVDSRPATIPTPPAAVKSLWVELEPGATVPLPPAPIAAHNESALVWTGTELIVWGGIVDVQPCCPYSHEGAAFDPATGTWRQIASPPDGVGSGVVVWTGTEMLVASYGTTTDTAGAAYDPATDTWRSIANPPAPATSGLWIGDEAVFVVGDPNVGSQGFAYDPATDEWRRLADGPWNGGFGATVWTGTTIITVADVDTFGGVHLAAYDPATDTWRILDPLDSGEQPVVIPGRGGAAATVAFLPIASGTPVELLDDRGNAIGELAGRPAELAGICETNPDHTACVFGNRGHAVSVGDEVLFFDRGDGWAFDQETQTWRSFPLDGREPTWDGTVVVAAGDLLFAWGAGRDGLVYRAATPG